MADGLRKRPKVRTHARRTSSLASWRAAITASSTPGPGRARESAAALRAGSEEASAARSSASPSPGTAGESSMWARVGDRGCRMPLGERNELRYAFGPSQPLVRPGDEPNPGGSAWPSVRGWAGQILADLVKDLEVIGGTAHTERAKGLLGCGRDLTDRVAEEHATQRPDRLYVADASQE